MWNPSQYLQYADHRHRPFVDLVARVDVDAPRRIVDLGCGPGNSTLLLADRWPDAALDALDSSAEMVSAARRNGLTAEQGDVRDWTPTEDTDLVVSNALLQWVPEHRELLAAWARALPRGAVIAVQMPGNFGAPSHRALREVARSAPWIDRLPTDLLRHDDTVDDPGDYARLLAGHGCAVDAWETTYIQQLSGPDPVLEWMRGTALTPVFDVLDADERTAFEADLAARLREEYPVEPDGDTLFPFRRVFCVATVGAALGATDLAG
ncbi:trans-aconitate 2-methyltransferase [Rhodococcoides corynebacterioides]|uniref:trans-aconitate 2-methyltransferase n=1 Tax=Rhodococcoides corynebacterioides TaxID=53972 RepID=UPI001C9A9C1D|nr:trans-aconitate 2-methyltransferase [Rhodococcus corynebacterioides]MBY6362151.1 trans-aconitate 2-methyltransferase [Rhodococcus corynebacterioides]